MDIRDEIDAMLDNLKSGGKNSAAPKSVPQNKREVPPPAQKKNVYDSMSVDDLLTALSSNKNRPENTVKKPDKPAASPMKETPKPQTKPGTTANAIPKNLLDILSGSQSSPRTNIRKPQQKLATAETPVLLKPDNYAPEPSETAEPDIPIKPVNAPYEAAADNVEILHDVPKENVNVDAPADSAEEYAEHDTTIEENAPSEPDETPSTESAETEAAQEETSDDAPDNEALPENDEECSGNTEEKTKPKKVRKSLLSGLKTVFSRKKSDESLTMDDEPTETIEEAPTDNEAEEKTSDELPDETPADTDETESGDVIANDTDDAAETDAAKENSAVSAAELVDAAITAIEELKLETSGEIAPDSADETDGSENKVEAEDGESSADELISDIREDAANTIAEISADTTGSSAAESNSDGNTPEESNADNSDVEKNINENINIDVQVSEQKRKGRLIAALEQILDENPDVISDERSEKTEDDEIDVSVAKKSSGRFKRHLYATCGVILSILAVIGLVSTVKFGLEHFRSFTAGEDKKDNFSEVIYPAVVMDIESFTSPSDLSSEQIISAALWSLVMSDDDMEKYEQTFDVISVPAIDVEAYAAKLFGEGLPEITHTTVGSGELKFYYNEETKSYNVPVNPIIFTYTPDITSVSKADGEYMVIVDYIKELPSWMKNNNDTDKEVSKTVEFKLHENDGSYTISSMTVINVNSII